MRFEESYESWNVKHYYAWYRRGGGRSSRLMVLLLTPIIAAMAVCEYPSSKPLEIWYRCSLVRCVWRFIGQLLILILENQDAAASHLSFIGEVELPSGNSWRNRRNDVCVFAVILAGEAGKNRRERFFASVARARIRDDARNVAAATVKRTTTLKLGNSNARTNR